MSSKANAPRRSGRAKRFLKDWKRLERSGRYPIYRINETPQGEEIVFVRTGTHAELFE